MRRERKGRKFRERIRSADESDDAVASVRDIKRENAGPAVGAIRSQSGESRDPERGI